MKKVISIIVTLMGISLIMAQVSVGQESGGGVKIWYKSMALPNAPWMSNVSFGFFSASKGEPCVQLKVEVNGTPRWTVSDPSVVTLEPTAGPEVVMKPLKEGKFTITVNVGSHSKVLSGSVADRGKDLLVTFSE